MNSTFKFATAFILLFLAACASTPEDTPEPQSWQHQRARVESISHFTANGKIALRTAEQAESASLLWQQMGPASHIRLSGPMGLSATTLDSDGDNVVIRQGEETRSWHLDDPQLQNTLGWTLPLQALHYWLMGVPAPALEIQALQLDPVSQLPQSMQQQGWLISYEEFADFDGFTLPTKLKVSRAETSARILLRQWRDIVAE